MGPIPWSVLKCFCKVRGFILVASQISLRLSGRTAGPQPFHGYYFELLTRQGANASGGEYDSVINGNMIGDYAMIAWPAVYGEGGIMTFVINQQGRLLEKDLGPKTAELAAKISVYNPDATWARSED